MSTQNKSNRDLLRDYYEGTRRNDEHEPSWVHPFFQPVLDGEALDDIHAEVARCLRRGTIEKTDFFGHPRIIDTDGWKVGTTTWIFLRRKSCSARSYKGWSIINASYEAATYWMAYNDDHPVGMSVMTDSSIGPALSLAKIERAIDAGASTAVNLGTRFVESPDHPSLLDLQGRHQQGDEFAERRATKDELAAEGLRWWPICFRGERSDDDAFGAAMVAYLPVIGDQDRPLDMRVFLRQIASARWCDQGFPVVQMAHTYAAALMATKVAPDLVTDVCAPWRAFVIQLPHPLVSIAFGTGEVANANMVLVRIAEHPERGTEWSFWVFHERGYLAYEGLAPHELLADDLNDDMQGCPSVIRGSAQVDVEVLNRIRLLIARLILNACCAMTNEPETLKPTRSAKPKRQVSRDRPGPPQYRVFSLGEPIQVDCRQAIRDFLTPGSSRRGSAPAVMTLVCGHRKQQAYGSRHSLRRPIWVQPYWRGPDGAPIVMRPHVLGGQLTKTRAPESTHDDQEAEAS